MGCYFGVVVFMCYELLFFELCIWFFCHYALCMQ